MEWFEYLAKASLVLSCMYLAYWLLFRYDTFHHLKRWVLLAGMLCSVGLPLVTITAFQTPVQVDDSPQVLTVPIEYWLLMQQSAEDASQEKSSWQEIMLIVYGVVVCALLLRLIFNLAKLFVLLHRHHFRQEEGYRLSEGEHIKTPFSFFRFILLPKMDPELRQSILVHEYAHASQYHTIDVLLFELYLAFFWFNPVAWLYRRQVRLNLEYLADAAALRSTNGYAYQMSLLRISAIANQVSLVNHFHFSSLKHRIRMINRANSSIRAGIKYVALPILLTGLVVAFHLTQAQTTVSLMPSEPNEQSSFTAREGTIDGFVVSANLNQPLAGVSVSLKGQQVGTLTDENGRFRLYTTKAEETLHLEHADYESAEVGVTLGSNRQANVGVSLQSYSGVDNNTVRGESWQTGKRDQLEIKKAIFIRDGERRPNEEIRNLNPNQFYITFLNKKEAMETFGAEGKYGAVIATPQNKPQQKPSTGFSDTSRLDKAIFIVNGKKLSANEMKKLDPDQIESMTVLKGEQAMALYGEEGRNGVILLTMRSGYSGTSIPSVAPATEWKHPSEPPPLYIVDGKEVAPEDMKKLDPDTIVEIIVMKDISAAREKYGKKGENGVIEIKLKRK